MWSRVAGLPQVQVTGISVIAPKAAHKATSVDGKSMSRRLLTEAALFASKFVVLKSSTGRGIIAVSC